MESLQLSELETIFNVNKGEHNSTDKFSVDSFDVGIFGLCNERVLDPVLERVFDFSDYIRSHDNISTPNISPDYSAHTSLPQVVLDATAIVHEEKYPGEGCVLPTPVVNFLEPGQNPEESDITTSYYSDDSCTASQPMPEFSKLTSPNAEVASTSFQWPPFNKVNIKSEEYDMPPCQNTHYGGASTTEPTSFPFVTSPSTSIPSPSSTIYSVSSPGTPGTSAPTRGRRPHGSTAPYSTKSSRRRQAEKGTVEYVEKRARNNVAVRKSRAKAKERQRETETRVKSLLDQNEQLQKKVDLLSKELTVLKGLFMNVGATLPDDFLSLIEDSWPNWH